ncbi:MAG: Cellulose biosynthesis protein BcsQ [Candidatus Methanocomedens sp.]|nr:MAG: Cellulose biosynthesis protein BcsQ [ANME-2 cluster archaeon]
MLNVNNTKPRVISFISGKGGSGKTTVAITITKLLAEMGFPCLLVDFDLATNGGSYFFKNQFTKDSKGIWETLGEASTTQLKNIPITISKNFYFVASRVNLNVKSESYDSINYQKDFLKKDVLIPLIHQGIEENIRYVIIDCQAGYSISSAAAVEVADMAIIVAEADSISDDAAVNLLEQLKNSLPDEKRYLINKIDVRDADTYRSMRNVFQSINRLPPLPFDFAVRNAFGARQIPIDLNNPSPLLFALFETVKYIFTEIFDKIESYKVEHIDILFEKYENKLQDLIEEKQKLEEELSEIKTRSLRMRYDLLKRSLNVTFAIIGILVVLYTYQSELGGYIFFERIFDPIFLTAMVSMVIIIFIYQLIGREYRAKSQDDIRERDCSRRLKAINDDLDQVRSLLWAKSKEYLVDVEVARGTVRMNSEEWKSYNK